MQSRKKIEDSIAKVEAWVEAHDYKGYDPGDGLNSFLRPLALGNSLAERVLLQLIWKSPVNVRPLVGIKPMDSTKGRGYMAWGYLLKVQVDAGCNVQGQGHCVPGLAYSQQSSGQSRLLLGKPFRFHHPQRGQSRRLTHYRLDQSDWSGVPGSIRADSEMSAS